MKPKIYPTPAGFYVLTIHIGKDNHCTREAVLAWRFEFPERFAHGSPSVTIQPITLDGVREDPAYIENPSGAVEVMGVGVWANVEDLMEEIEAGGAPRL